MKFIQIVFLITAITLSSCEKDSKAMLNQLKNERKELDSKIEELQKKFETQNPKKQKAVPVYVDSVRQIPFKKFIEIQGKVDAKNNVLATALSSSTVTRILVSNGQYVKRNQILAYLDNDVMSQSIREAELQEMFAFNLYEKQKQLWKEDIGTEIQLLTAKNNYETAVKRKKTLITQRDMYLIKSPISGMVDDVMIKVGDFVGPGVQKEKGIRIVNDANLKVVVDVGESYVSSVNRGDEVSVIFPDINDSIKTKISFVAKTIDEIKRTFKVEVNLPYKKKIKPNMLAEIKIQAYSNPKAMVVNFGIIQNDSMGDYIMVIREGKVTKAPIIKGESYNGKTEILEGILPNDLIITAGFEGLMEGDLVKIVPNI